MRKEKKIDEHFMLACSRGAIKIFYSEKMVGVLTGVGVLNGMNTVFDDVDDNSEIILFISSYKP